MASGEDVDYDKLEEYLRALSHSRRLELLHILRLPQPLHEIRLSPGRMRAGDAPDRPVSRQAIQEHLNKLAEIGVVVARDAGAAGRRGREYLVNPQRVYQIAEEFRKLATITVGGVVARDATVEMGGPAAREMDPGPKLVLVHGYLEGKAFPLRRADLGDGRSWSIGRKPGLHVSLEYDPFVSLVNSEVRIAGDDYLLADLGSSKNGTWLNWRPLGADPVPLRPGDVVGVGRSLLVFRRD